MGSANIDLVAKIDRLPLPGETIIGNDFFQNQGGKGANQAVAAARLGGEVTFVANVGQDAHGEMAINSYIKEGMVTKYIRTVEKPTGVALITVDTAAENSIVVIPGANATLNESDIDKTLGEIDENTIVLLQLESPIPTVEYAINKCKSNGATVVLNPAPAKELQKQTLQSVDIITPNETELTLLTGVEIKDETSFQTAVDQLHHQGVETIIVTLGAQGCYLSSPNIKQHFKFKSRCY